MALSNVFSDKLQLSPSKSKPKLSDFLDEKSSDVTVNVGLLNSRICSYKLHRNILSGCSAVLQQLLTSSDTNESYQTLDVTFMSPADFELLIIFFYTGDVFFETVSELCSGLYAANLFQLDNLLITCTARLQEKIEEDSRNSLLILKLNERFNCREENFDLFDQVDEMIIKNYRKILSLELIEELEVDTLKHLLQMNSFYYVPEIEFFRAILRWTNAQCSKYGIYKAAGNLIYLIRNNLIPREILETEILRSELLLEGFFSLLLERYNDDTIEVPFCTQIRGKYDVKEVHLESTCTVKEHEVMQVSRWSTVNTLLWNDDSDYCYLSTVASTNTRWEVKFVSGYMNDFGISVRCASLDERFCAASMRLFAVVEDYPQVWMEVAEVLKSNEVSCGYFSKKMSELSNVRPLKVVVHVKWTELEQLSSAHDLWKNTAALIHCRWLLKDWKIVNPTSDWPWWLISETFGQNGALWRIFVRNQCEDRGAYCMVKVELQNLPASVIWSDLSWSCSISLWNRQLDELKEDMKLRSFCVWTIVDDVNSEIKNLLDLEVKILVDRKN